MRGFVLGLTAAEDGVLWVLAESHLMNTHKTCFRGEISILVTQMPYLELPLMMKIIIYMPVIINLLPNGYCC